MNGGLIVAASVAAARHRRLIITLAARHRLPAIYVFRNFVVDGGLLSYGLDIADQYRASASDCLKTAKTLNLTIPSSLLARADEVIG